MTITTSIYTRLTSHVVEWGRFSEFLLDVVVAIMILSLNALHATAARRPPYYKRRRYGCSNRHAYHHKLLATCVAASPLFVCASSTLARCAHEKNARAFWTARAGRFINELSSTEEAEV
jgi:lipopolysaccharide/colanic/teichoic acid biosynthesis glycosyltransferase